MQHAELILAGGVVVTMNATFDLIPDGAVAINKNKICAVGTRTDITSQYLAVEMIDCAGKYILPGLVNAHTHVPMTLLRGLADDLRLDVWLMGYCMPTERQFVTPEFCRLGTSLAAAEMIRSGITSFADMYYFEADVAAATVEAGMRAVLGQTILKFPAPDAETYENSLEYAERFIQDWQGHPLITPAVAPHAPYSTTPDLLGQCATLAKKYDVPILIHIAETRLEVDDSLEQYGQPVVPWVESSGLLEAKVLAAHCVHISPGEMRVLHNHNCAVAHCPTSNLKLAAGIAPVNQFLQHGLVVGIGTDGPASNNDLDMFEEVRLAAILAKTAANDPTAVPAREALLMATRKGAEALFLGDTTGSLEIGKAADILVMDSRTVHNMPQFHRDSNAIYSQIVYAAKSTDVRHVICNGRWLMRDRVLLTVDEASLLEQAAVYASRVDQFLSTHEKDTLSKLLVIGGLERGESFEVQVKALLKDPVAVERLLVHADVQVLKKVHYRQYDTYFVYSDPDKGRVRYREDDLINDHGDVESVRSRLTFTMPTKAKEYDSTIGLSHSRFLSKAERPLRFYREYLQADREQELQKDRLRYHILYQGVLFYMNIDRLTAPLIPDTFIEIKSRTWSGSDASHKASRIQEMLQILRIEQADLVTTDYLEMRLATD